MVWWEMSPIPDRAAAPPGREIPDSFACPLDGFRRPAMTLRSVVFPAPLGPNRARHSPSRREKDTPATARLAPKFRVSPATSRSRCAVRGLVAVICLELATLARGAQNGVSFRARLSLDAQRQDE